MIHSHINYCLNVYSCANTTNLQRLRFEQKEAIPVICNAGFRANNLQIPAHHYASLKRLPLFSFPQVWNAESERKFIPSLKVYSKH